MALPLLALSIACLIGDARAYEVDVEKKSECSCSYFGSRFDSLETDLQLVTQKLNGIQEQLSRKVCPYGFDYLPEIDQCLKLYTEKMTWNDAQEICGRVMPGVQMVTVTNSAKQEAVKRYLQHQFTKTETNVCIFVGWGKVVWIGGQTENPNLCGTPYLWRPLPAVVMPFAYSNWRLGEPNCWQNEEHCVIISSEVNYAWNDDKCSRSNCFICEF